MNDHSTVPPDRAERLAEALPPLPESDTDGYMGAEAFTASAMRQYALAAVQAKRGWRPIETAPKDGTLIDLWADGERVVNCRWAGAGWLTIDDGCDWAVSEDPTHWLPLPEPPKG